MMGASGAGQIVEAARHGRAHLTPGWPARTAEVAHALAPELFASATAAAARWLLPAPGDGAHADEGRLSSDLDLGFISGFFATQAALAHNQRLAADEAARLQPVAGTPQ
jgi:hypothetical protein